MSTGSEPIEIRHAAPDVRADENAVRLLLVGESPVCTGLLCAALDRAPRGRFDVDCTACLTAAARVVALAEYDAVLVDLGVPDDAGDAIEAVCEIAHRVPVIALAGTREGVLEALAEEEGEGDEAPGWEALLGCVDRADLAGTILRAVRRHRRLGVCGAEPTFCRLVPA